MSRRTTAERIVRASVQRSAALASLEDAAGKRATREILAMLKAADLRLTRKLAKMAARGGDGTFSFAQAVSTRAQMHVAIQFTEARLLGLTQEQAMYAVSAGVRSTGNLLASLDLAFTGINTPLNIRQAAAINRLTSGLKASLLSRHESSVNRYGDAMMLEMEKRIREGILDGKTVTEMVDSLVKLKGPSGVVSVAEFVKNGVVVHIAEQNIQEGLFVKYRSWAERIVRTETANAYEEANMWSLYEARQDVPDIKKKILAVFDNRTAYDSIAVHGQVRALDGYFIDGAGREYLHPPARPNDRETVVPWRPGWEEDDYTSPKSAKVAGDAIANSTRLSAAARAQSARSGAAERRKAARAGAAGLRADQAKNAAQARRGKRAVS